MIIVNSNNIDFVENETVSGLLKRMKYVFPNVVVKINGRLVKRTDFADTIIPDKSEVSVIHMISGG
ncbi:MAG: sulfur carrier protein ThiS [Candidatus Thermoplasmatota archaeon]|nr:sulfur carrier protein ThiS [Candidatus Thermoplasmatota archaeon]